MLSVMLFGAGAALKTRILQVLDSLDPKPALKIADSTSSFEEMLHCIRSSEDTLLAILCLKRQPADNREACMQLGQLIMQKNRDNYVVYCLHDISDFEKLAWQCMRPAGIILPPMHESHLRAVLSRIAEDYTSVHADSTNENRHHLIVQSGTATHRIAFHQICYLEAIDKKITVFTQRQSIVLRNTLGSIAQKLPSCFVRCHRSYIVNLNCIESADFAQMTLQLNNGDVLPVSRSCKDMLRQLLKDAEEAKNEY